MLTLDFDDSDNHRSDHYAFLASDGEVNHLHQRRGLYFECDNGHVWEVITHTYITD